ncbi:MAG: hypothetical protein IJG84_16260 [Kiritimatiellae bacterium]|nr:hypothetical protein [Kiritimatiellia bacterium]
MIEYRLEGNLGAMSSRASFRFDQRILRRVSSDARFADDYCQFRIFMETGKWCIEGNLDALNLTMVNGDVLSGSRRELQTGDVIELVGRTSGKKAMRIVFLSEGTLSAEEVELQDILLAGWKKFSPEIDITQFVLKTQWDSNRIFACRRDARYNHPEIFYYDGSGSIRRTISPSGSLLACKLVGLKYDFPASELDARTHELDAAVAKAMATVEGVSDDAEKALRLHDYIIKVCDYDDVAAKGKDSSCLARTVYSVLVRGRAVCEGYTMAYRHLLNAVGIISEETVGNDGRHVWNYVRISGRWYHVDVTWDDTLHSGYDRTSGFISRRNFLMSDNRARETGHKGWDVHGLPPADDNSYDLRFQC